MSERKRLARVVFIGSNKDKVERGARGIIETALNNIGLEGSFEVIACQRRRGTGNVPRFNLKRLDQCHGVIVFTVQPGDNGTRREYHLQLPEDQAQDIFSLFERSDGNKKDVSEYKECLSETTIVMNVDLECILATLSEVLLSKEQVPIEEIRDVLKSELDCRLDDEMFRQFLSPLLDKGYVDFKAEEPNNEVLICLTDWGREQLTPSPKNSDISLGERLEELIAIDSEAKAMEKTLADLREEEEFLQKKLNATRQEIERLTSIVEGAQTSRAKLKEIIKLLK